MRETPAGRDRRDIVVPGDMRDGRSGRAGPRRMPRATAPQGALGSVMTFARTAAQFCLRHPGGALGTVLGAGAALTVCLNAVGFQEGRHPAPILPTVEAKALDAKTQAAKAAPARAADPKLAEAKPVPARTAPPREVRTEAPAPAPRDPIADMLRSSETTASVTPKPSVRENARPAVTKPDPAKLEAAKSEAAKSDAAKPDPAKPDPAKPDPQVARVQRALAKLGYGPLKDDGMMGPGTKAAIERFERDRKLPVKGEAAGRTLRELTAKASATQG